MRAGRFLCPVILWAAAAQAFGAEGPVVGLDRYYHHETRDGKQVHYAWEDTSPGGYSKLAAIIEGLGARTTSITKPASQGTLAGVDVYLIVNPDTPKTVPDPNYIDDAAVEAIDAWVKAGGVLVLLNNDRDHAEFAHMNKLAGRFGIAFNEDVLLGVADDPQKKLQLHAFPDHPFFKGVQKLHMRSISTLRVQPPAQEVYRFQDRTIVAVCRHGKGTVFALGDPWGYNEYADAYDNRAGLTNVFGWLLDQARTARPGLPAAPRAAAKTPNAQAIAEVAAGRQATARASWWGFDSRDSTAALQAAINSGAKKLIVEDMGTPWIVNPLQLAGDQEIVFEKGVVVQAKRGSFLRRTDALMTIRGRQNVTLTGHGATLRMWREDYDRPPYEHAEWRHVIAIYGSSRVRIAGLTLAESGGDGIYVSGAASRDIEIRDVVCDRNYRQGISIISVENLLIENCVLRDTAGTSPMAGIDFEPNHPTDRLVNCVMRNCVAENNRSAGYIVSVRGLRHDSMPLSIRLENCRSQGNQSGLRIITGNGPIRTAVPGTIDVVNCTFQADRDGGIVVDAKPADGCRVRFVNCQLIDTPAGQNDKTPILLASGPGSTQDIGGLEFVDCLVKDPVDRLPMKFLDVAGGLRLVGVTGTLTVDRAGKRTAYTLDQRQIDAWMPQRAFQRIPPFDAKGVRYVPAFPEAPAAFRAVSGCTLRRSPVYLLWAEAGRPAEFTLSTRAVGKSLPKTVPVRLISPAGKEKRLADARGGEPTPYSFTPEATGAWRIACQTGGARVEVLSTTNRVCLYAEQGLFNFLGAHGELFFWVPPGVKQCAVRLCGDSLGERVKGALYNPAGQKVDEADSIAEAHQFLVNRPTAEQGEAWSIRLGRPAVGVLEDFHLELQGIAPVLATQREALLRPEK